MAAVPPGYDAGVIAGELGRRIEALAAQLLPQGRLDHGRLWRVGSIEGEPGQSLCVWLAGARQGRWRDFAGDQWGDALDLVALTCCRGDKAKAVRWARDWLGMGRLDPDEAARLAARARQRADAGRAEALPDERNRRNDAFSIWRAALPLAPGDPAWRYLAGRGVDLARLAPGARRPPVGALRCHPALYHPDGRSWPALVALIAGRDGKPAAIHRTWLDPRNLACEDAPRVGKAPVGNPKMTLGRYAGGLIRLWRGQSGRPWAQMPAGETLVLGEGLEDTLTGVLRWPQWRAACAVSLSAMLALDLPPEITEIRLLAQRDPPGSTASVTLDRVARRFRSQGRRVFLLDLPVFVKDINQLETHPISALLGGRSSG